MLAPGFADPVFDSQQAFRCVMDAMARPGTVRSLAMPLVPPAGLPHAAAAVLLFLCDYETPVWLAPSLARRDGVSGYVRFHTGAPITQDMSAAHFAFADAAQDPLDLAAFAQGTPEYPDRAATVIILCGALTGGDPLLVSGPGTRACLSIAPQGLQSGFADQLKSNHARFPLGVDVLLIAGASMLALPRSTRVTREAR